MVITWMNCIRWIHTENKKKVYDENILFDKGPGNIIIKNAPQMHRFGNILLPLLDD